MVYFLNIKMWMLERAPQAFRGNQEAQGYHRNACVVKPQRYATMHSRAKGDHDPFEEDRESTFGRSAVRGDPHVVPHLFSNGITANDRERVGGGHFWRRW